MKSKFINIHIPTNQDFIYLSFLVFSLFIQLKEILKKLQIKNYHTTYIKQPDTKKLY